MMLMIVDVAAERRHALISRLHALFY